jgi:hypothetical protein
MSCARSPSPLVPNGGYTGSWFVLALNQPGTGASFPVGLLPLQVDSPCNHLAKPRLLAACVGPHGYISGASYFTTGDHPPAAITPTAHLLPVKGMEVLTCFRSCRSLIPRSRFRDAHVR